ncbi:MAG: MoaD/ThiS family protein [Phycisphaerales bacterium]
MASGRVRVTLPFHLRTLSGVEAEAVVDVDGAVTIGSVLEALEAKHPMLRGTIRDHGTLKRRAFLRYFACGRDWSLESADVPLPEAVARGEEPFHVVGAIAGG